MVDNNTFNSENRIHEGATRRKVELHKASAPFELLYSLALLGIFLMACRIPKSPYPRCQSDSATSGLRNLPGRPRFHQEWHHRVTFDGTRP